MAADPDPSRPTRIRVEVCDALGRPVAEPRSARSLARWLAGIAPAAARGTVTVVLASDARLRKLNHVYRGKDSATDVLSFPTDGDTKGRRSAPHEQKHLGDIVIARGVMARQAKAAGHAAATELRILALHGLLHLLGYDHERDAGEMARVERRLRRRGGLREGLIERAV